MVQCSMQQHQQHHLQQHMQQQLVGAGSSAALSAHNQVTPPRSRSLTPRSSSTGPPSTAAHPRHLSINTTHAATTATNSSPKAAPASHHHHQGTPTAASVTPRTPHTARASPLACMALQEEAEEEVEEEGELEGAGGQALGSTTGGGEGLQGAVSEGRMQGGGCRSLREKEQEGTSLAPVVRTEAWHSTQGTPAA